MTPFADIPPEFQETATFWLEDIRELCASAKKIQAPALKSALISLARSDAYKLKTHLRLARSPQWGDSAGNG